MIAAVLSLILCAAPLPPTQASFTRAVQATEHAWVEVSSARGKGPGLTVGRGGEVLTPVASVTLEHAKVRAGKARVEGRVLAASAYLGTAVVRPERSLAKQPPAVNTHAKIEMGGWLIALDAAHPRSPRAVRVLTAPEANPFLQIADNLPVGTVLLDANGALVAYVIRRQAASATAVRVSAIKTQLLSVAAKDAP